MGYDMIELDRMVFRGRRMGKGNGTAGDLLRIAMRVTLEERDR